MSCHSLIAIVLVILLTAPGQFLFAGQTPGQPAQQPPPAAPSQSTAANAARPVQGKLRILVLEGENSVNSIAAGSAISPVVQVLDSMMQPVQGASVAFEVPPSGPGGVFGDKPVAITRTDYQGQATAEFTPNNTAGTFTIKVTATMGDQKVEARIHQSNSKSVKEATVKTPPKSWRQDWKWWAVIGVGAGAGVAAALILTGGNNKSTIIISPGGPVIGGPQ